MKMNTLIQKSVLVILSLFFLMGFSECDQSSGLDCPKKGEWGIRPESPAFVPGCPTTEDVPSGDPG